MKEKMAKMSKLVLVLSIVLMSVGLTSCLDGDNTQTFATVAQVDYEASTGKYLLYSVSGEVFYPQGLANQTSIELGKCYIFSVTYNSDEQPSGTKYPVVIINNWEDVFTGRANSTRGEMDDSYNDTIKTALFYRASEYMLTNNIAYLQFAHAYQKDQEDSYELICNVDSIDSKNNPYMYFKRQKTKTGTGVSADVAFIAAFDLSNVLYNYTTKDTTIGQYTYTKYEIPVKYQVGVDPATEKAIYKEFDKNPIVFLKSRN